MLLPRKSDRKISHQTTLAACPPKKLASINTHSVFLQAGAFANKAYAVKLKSRLAAMQTFPVRISMPNLNSKLYRVQIGPIHDTASAQKISLRLKSIGISAKKVQGV
jgi:cell division protein FtsN